MDFTRFASRTPLLREPQGYYRIGIDILHFLLANMSDYGDEMDVDDGPVKESVMFSSDNTNAKGKRSAANLPIEAEDSLPW